MSPIIDILLKAIQHAGQEVVLNGPASLIVRAQGCTAGSLMQACALRDLETAWEAVHLAKRPRVHTFLATSEIHMKHKLKMTPDQARLTCQFLLEH